MKIRCGHLPAQMYGEVTAEFGRRKGGSIHWIHLGPVVIAWHRKRGAA